jgi:hypothetical protein
MEMQMYTVEKCEICKPEDHEGKFCRCESRNIDIAKQIREKKESPWKKLRGKEKTADEI